MGDLTPLDERTKTPARPTGTRPARLPPYQVLDRMLPIAQTAEMLRPSSFDFRNFDNLKRTHRAVEHARAVIESGEHRKAVEMLRRATAPATMQEIAEAINNAIKTCTRVPSGLDVEQYSRKLALDIAHMAPNRIEFSLAMIEHRFASPFLPDTSDISNALDAVRERRMCLPIGIYMSPREVLAAVEALPARLAFAGEMITNVLRRTEQCLADRTTLTLGAWQGRWWQHPDAIEAVRRHKATRALEDKRQ